MALRKLLTPRWVLTTLFVIIAVGVMIRLGIWQLDRLQERRASNAKIEAQINAPAINLNDPLPSGQPLTGMEYRPVTVRGVWDPQNEIILRNQVNATTQANEPGYHLITPLHIQGSSASVLVDRGFIPLNQAQPEARLAYAQAGPVEVTGMIRLPYVPRFFGVPDPTLAPGQARLDTWNYINFDRIQQQTSYPLLPVYIQAAPARFIAPSPNQSGYPIASVDQPDLTEGPHLGYAFQWFSFAAILAIGYPFLIKKQLTGTSRKAIKQNNHTVLG